MKSVSIVQGPQEGAEKVSVGSSCDDAWRLDIRLFSQEGKFGRHMQIDSDHPAMTREGRAEYDRSDRALEREGGFC